MTEEYRRIIEESIRIELQVADLYLFFYKKFPEDEGFWWQIAVEEKNHAALIRSLFDVSEQLMECPGDMFSNSLLELLETNRMLSSLLDKFEAMPPDRESAFNTALRIEGSAGELHYQCFMENDKESNLQISKIFQQLNNEDKDHSARIRSYMEKNDLHVM